MNNYDNLIEFLAANKIDFETDLPLSKRTTFEIGGNAKLVVQPKCVNECKILTEFLNSNNLSYFILGKGSNLLCSDNGLSDTIIYTKKLVDIELIDDDTIKCGGGLSLGKLCEFAANNSLTGLEFAFGIPGSVGGAIYMNAGAYGGEIKDVLTKCEVINNSGEVDYYKNEQMEFSYRRSVLSNKSGLVTYGYFKLQKGNKEDIKNKMSDIIKRRKDKQPLEYPSAGSIFKRPVSGYASALIEECGLKGRRVGGAQVSVKHSGFIINKGGASQKDVLELIDIIKKEVKLKKGIELETEVKLLN